LQAATDPVFPDKESGFPSPFPAESYKFGRLKVYRSRFGRVADRWCQKVRKKCSEWRNVLADVIPMR